ncbi:PREDICTED: IQ and ubiquitin-like domain-containing protein [Amphimedon queenslandica]|uniref:Ubiquitin-like domain-containing protein n=1 Tax=Amphimedon queenslandica TaxID=400682 RepID=A0AAN0JWW5_AMPQE|nr:PREDICTED: IQ and ubiquitin-like domain-containing protein [Amphimedon queenslandica]|eukprot:XP_019861687.1 PREDICTED: IQ and ubiquitin-like domain-containing protein [Amphimedon queenslandica]
MATVEASVPSAEPQEEGESTEDKVEVVFAIENSSEDVKDLFSLSDSVQKLKEYLSQKFGNSSDTFILSLDGETLSNNATVDQFGVVAGSSIELQVKILTPLALPVSKEEEEEEKLKKEKEREEEELGYDERIFTVQVRLAQEMKELLVKMEKARIKKPFLGGYRDKQTGQEYHHASAQTLPRRKPDTGIAMFERDTQTVFTRNCYQQVMVDAATQMNQTGCYITSVTDKIKIPGPYETADEYHGKILKKIIILQSHWRRWLATKYVNAVREEKLMRELWEREEALRKQREREARRKAEFERRMNPRTKKDFDLLYHALEMWRKDELERINNTTAGPERKAALCMLLEQEATLIASIGRHKVVADVENQDKQVKQFLEAVNTQHTLLFYATFPTFTYTKSTLAITKTAESDLRYLIENIWAGQSAVSGEKDLFELILVRWNITEHWSPWNCILLTTDEARAHVKLDDPEKAYSSQFTDKIRQRHILARNYFTQIPGMMEEMSTKVKELPLPRPKERIIVVRQHPQEQHQQLTVDSN